MFEQHPVPQQISSYQFRLVGDMTLKQFFQLAAGAVLGLLIYASPLPSLFKWPLIILFVVSGAAFAFLPLQERPLSEWLASFFRAIYGPTVYTWQKNKNAAGYFAMDDNQPKVSSGGQNIKPQDASVAKLEASENSFLSKIAGGLGIAPAASNTTPPVQLPQPQIIIKKEVPTAPVTPPAPTAGTLFVVTPQAPSVKIEKQAPVQMPINRGQETITTSSPKPTDFNVTAQTTTAATFSPEAAPPTPSTIPNIIVGQVTSSVGKIIDSAIMEVKDFQGRPVRALKTNNLGHFMIVTPLPSGSYTITTEKDGYSFEPITIETHGAVVPPILIKSKN